MQAFDCVPADFLEKMCAIPSPADAIKENVALQGAGMGGGRTQTLKSTRSDWLPDELYATLTSVVEGVFPELRDMQALPPKLIERLDAPSWAGYQVRHRDFSRRLAWARDACVVFVPLTN